MPTNRNYQHDKPASGPEQVGPLLVFSGCAVSVAAQHYAVFRGFYCFPLKVGTRAGHLSKKNKRVELIVLMRPTVLRTPEVAAMTARDETSKLPGIRGAVRDFEEENKTRMERAGDEPELFRSWNQRTNTEPAIPLEVIPDGTH